MGQNLRGCRRLSLLGVWQLGLAMACMVASKAPHDAGTGVAGSLRRASANMLTVDLHTDVFQPPDQCRKPEPCYHNAGNAGSEFCVFAANAKDDMGISKIVPMVTTQGRALKLMHMLSDTPNTSKHARSSTPKYTIRPVPGKGLGVISTNELNRGDHILSDLPTLIVDHCMMSIVPQYHLAKLMNEAAGRLYSSQLDRLMSLDVFGDEAPDEHYLVGRIYATSAYMLDPDGVLFGGGCGLGALFPEISRMNHDCRPNAAYHFNPDTAMMEVHAVRPIAAGEEITVSYISPFISHAHRQSLLHDRWGFKCTCAACSAPAANVNASDTRLEMISSIWPFLLDKPAGDSFKDSDKLDTTNRSELADLLVSLAETEGLDAVMLQPYRAAALEWNALGEAGKATSYARFAVEYGINSFGPRNPMVRDMQDLIQDPELHWSWKLR
ncbi:SET domain-containing protein 5 [Gnomoniopsis smithogilvyi]|uniref:SET domain-containing protein 5 n=1 Tax=Gnomoniopsis smithogilvyi TaxID=1191159 RepID=A0A9W8YS32_9PEZI|nr:SET domain-containing protein 5 [Gnomoniopsis smithogilvyi]